MSTNLILVLSTFLSVVTLIMVAVSFATDHWIETLVDRTSIEADGIGKNVMDFDLRYFKSNRGLFRTCYPGNETGFISSARYDTDRIDSSCLWQRGYEISRRTKTLTYGSDYTLRIHLMRCHFSFFVIAIIVGVVAIISGGIGFASANSKTIRTTALFMFIVAFFIAGGMAFFHGYEYLENNKIMQDEFPAYYLSRNEFRTLKTFSSTNYGYSYILGWMSMACATITAILFLYSAYSINGVYKGESAMPGSQYKQRQGPNGFVNGLGGAGQHPQGYSMEKSAYPANPTNGNGYYMYNDTDENHAPGSNYQYQQYPPMEGQGYGNGGYRG